MNDAASAIGAVAVVAIVVVVVLLVVLWIFLPFVVYGIRRRLDRPSPELMRLLTVLDDLAVSARYQSELLHRLATEAAPGAQQPPPPPHVLEHHEPLALRRHARGG